MLRLKLKFSINIVLILLILSLTIDQSFSSSSAPITSNNNISNILTSANQLIRFSNDEFYSNPSIILKQIYMELYAQLNSKSTKSLDISEVVDIILAQFRTDIIKYNRHIFPIPTVHITFSDTAYNVKGILQDGAVTGAETITRDGPATLSIDEDNGNIKIDLQLKVITGSLKINVGIKLLGIGPSPDPNGSRIQGVIDENTTRYLLGVYLSPSGTFGVHELTIVKKGEVTAEVHGWGNFIFWITFFVWFSVVLILLLVGVSGVAIYLYLKLRKINNKQ